jgi:hypothetical protein
VTATGPLAAAVNANCDCGPRQEKCRSFKERDVLVIAEIRLIFAAYRPASALIIKQFRFAKTSQLTLSSRTLAHTESDPKLAISVISEPMSRRRDRGHRDRLVHADSWPSLG